MLSREQVHRKVENLRVASRERDQRQRDVHDVRSGDIDTVIPGAMPDPFPRPIVANEIDINARDIAEVMGQMPSINCSSSIQTSDRSKKFASKRTKIAHHYVQVSHLQAGEMVRHCDHYSTYGFGILIVEPDFEKKTPRIRVEDPMGAYPEFDVFGQLRSYSRVWQEKASTLIAKYPSLEQALKPASNPYEDTTGWAEREVEICKYMDADQFYMYLPAHGSQPIQWMPNPMGKLMVSIDVRPSYDSEIRGAYDDVVWVYLAKSRMAMLGMEATEKSVRSPLMLPRDTQTASFGGDQIMRSDTPQNARYLVPDMPQYAFQLSSILEGEVRKGTRSPEARTGNIDTSIITGKGVEALLGGFKTVITTGQQIVGQALTRAIKMCFEMDEMIWPDEKKTIRGMVQGTPFEETYTPSKDINGNHTVDVTYGFASGQDPARAIVALLQLRGDQLVSRDFVQRQLPMEIDVVQMQTQIDNEQFEDALKAGIQGAMQAIPQMALQGMDPMDPLMKMAKVIKLREGGKPVHDAVLEAFKPKEAPEGPPAAPGMPPGPTTLGGAPGAAMTPAGAPGMMEMLASLRGGGNAQMNVRTRRQMPIR